MAGIDPRSRTDRLNRHNTAIMAVFTADTPEVVQ